MLDSDAALDEAQVNLARLATIWHEDVYPDPESQLLHGPFRAVDQRLGRAGNALGWVVQQQPALHLYWAAEVVVHEVVLYPLPEGSHTSAPVCGAVPSLQVDSIEPARGSLGAVTSVVIRGRGFSDANDIQPAIGGFRLLDFVVVDDPTIKAMTRSDRPREPGTFDVSVSYANGLRAGLAEAFEFSGE